MKIIEKQEARRLRAFGYSINEIVGRVGVSKSSASLWVRDIELTSKQRQQLSERGFRKDAIEKRREARLRNEAAKRQIIIDNAQKEVGIISHRELLLIGTALYWAEGGKTKRGVVRFSNSDPEMIKIIMRFFREECNVPEEKFRGHIHIHPHLNHIKAKQYWSFISRIPEDRFFKTYRKASKASRHKKDSLPYGTFDVCVCSTELFLKILGWTRGIFESNTI